MADETIFEERRKVIGFVGRFYEDFCNSFGILFKLPFPDEGMRRNLEKAADFSSLNITPDQVFSSTVILFFLTAAFFALGILTNLPAFVSLMFLVFGAALSIWFFYYPVIFARSMMIKQSAEGILAILYMVISLKSVSNMENAVKFAAQNLHGPVGYSMKKIMWEVYAGKYTNIIDALTEYSQRWKFENREFTESLDLVISSVGAPQQRQEKMLSEALDIVLGGTEEKMKHYGEDLKVPVMLLNTLGILLPLIGMSMFPIVIIFMAESVKPFSLIFIYNICLPLVVYALIRTVLHKRPWTFTQPDVSEHPEAVPLGHMRMGTVSVPVLPLSIIASSVLILLGLAGYMLYPAQPGSFTLLFYSTAILWGITAFFSIYLFGTSYQNIRIINDVKKIEHELEFVLFKIGNELYKGEPIETAISSSTREKEFKSTELFQKISQNIKMFGMTLEQAVLDKEAGAIKYFPSTLTKSVMRVVSETSKRGLMILSEALMTISSYLKKMHNVEERLKEVLEESLSEMSFQSTVLTPVVAGSVMGLVFVVIGYLFEVQAMFSKIDLGPVNNVVSFSLSVITDVNKAMPIDQLQLVVGIYMLETVWLISLFQSMIEFGEESTTVNYLAGKNIFIATVVYSLVMLGIAFVFKGMFTMIGM